ncbi:5346_t:CDS:2, partial [Gigaspora margarita]
ALNTLTSSYNYFQSYAISHSQWTALEKIVEFLEPFKDLTIKISSSSNSTAFWIIPLFNIVFNHVKNVASTVDKSASKIQYQTVASFNNNIPFDISSNTVGSYTRSILDTDFEDEEEYINELDHYILEKPANKEIEVLA